MTFPTVLLAEIAGVSNTHASRYRRGIPNLSDDELVALRSVTHDLALARAFVGARLDYREASWVKTEVHWLRRAGARLSVDSAHFDAEAANSG